MARRHLKVDFPDPALKTDETDEKAASAGRDKLVIKGLRQNNLKNLNIEIPHNRITAIVGPSGSGKSSLAFDSLFAEGRWRFIESLSTYTRLFLERMDRPELDSIVNIRPAIAVEQKNPVRTSRSTVGTATEINDYLRLLFARIGVVHCPRCGGEVTAETPTGAAEKLLTENKGEALTIGFATKIEEGAFNEAIENLLKKGFFRIRAGGKAYDLNFERPEAPETKKIDVVVDRLVIKGKERARLTDSLETSYREGGGEAWVEFQDKRVEKLSNVPACRACDIPVERPTPLSLSFNHPVGACPGCKGFGNVLKYDHDRIIPDKTLSLRDGAIEPWTKPSFTWWYEELEAHAGGYGIDLDAPFEKLPAKTKKLLFKGTDAFEGIDEFFGHLEKKKYKLHIKVFTSRYKGQFLCGACGGARLRREALTTTVGGMNISELSAMTISGARAFFKRLRLSKSEKAVSKEALKQIGAKLDFLSNTGLGYIALDRLTKTLSGGEAQRVSIATQLASSLTGVLYILDEPSVGLHAADIERLSEQLKKLSSRGNTVVVVEHDPEIIRTSDYILELGPGAGRSGGRLVYGGPATDFIKEARTLTSGYLTGRKVIHVPRWRRKGTGAVTLKGASGNNLKRIDVSIPLKTLTCVTGVSGSGKSTLVVDTLYKIIASRFSTRAGKPLPYRSVNGLERLRGVKLVDQSPIGRTPRSIPVTYIGAFDSIRRFFAGLPAARASALTQSHFSFNIPSGRCEACGGDGVERLEMYFLPDVYIRCGACGGKRYKPQVLGVKYRGRNISHILNMTFDEAARVLPDGKDLQKRFAVMRDVGLGYLKLGQSALTLSGGEAQRLKIAKELIDVSSDNMLYIFDEPTTGLHMDDTKKLLTVLGRLVDAGNTVLIIEHNLDLIKTADFIIDLGPGGGVKGGRVVGFGAPEEIAKIKRSKTGRFLKEVLSG